MECEINVEIVNWIFFHFKLYSSSLVAINYRIKYISTGSTAVHMPDNTIDQNQVYALSPLCSLARPYARLYCSKVRKYR
jgi:hypothetical protein